MTMKRIVFGDDHSPGADVAWGWLNAQDWSGWPVDVISVVPHDYTPEVHETEPEFFPNRDTVVAAGLAPVTSVTVEGDPRVVLLEHAEDGLLVVGARGAGGLEGMIVGSTTDWLMRSPPGPMIIARDASPVREVLVCVDGSHHAMAAVRAAAQVPWLSTARCTVLGVADTAESPRAVCEEAATVLRAAGAQVATRILELDGAAYTLRPDRTILDEIEARQPDLIVMGTQGRTGLARLWFGSVAGAVVHRTSTNILLAKASE